MQIQPTQKSRAADLQRYVDEDRYIMNQIELQNLAEELETLKESELIYVLSKVLPKYNPFKGDPVIEGSRFVLGVAIKKKANIN